MASIMSNMFIGSTIGSLKGVNVTRGDSGLKVSAKNLIRDRADLGSQNEIKCMNWSDERQEEILIGSKNGVRTFNVVDNVISNSLVLPEDESCGIFKSDGKIFVGITSGCVQSVTVSESEPKWTEVLRLNNRIERLRRSVVKSDIVATGGKDNDLKLWDLTSQQTTFIAKNIKPDELQLQIPTWVSDIAFCRHNESVGTCSRHGYVRLYDPLLPQRRPVFSAHQVDQVFTCMSCAPGENQFLVGSGTGDLFLVDVRGKTPFAGKFKSFTGAVKEVVCPPNQSLVFSVSLDRHLRVHDIVTRKLILKPYLIQLLSLLSTLSASTSLSDTAIPPDHGPKLCEPEYNFKYDFIVCGAGSAGAALAARLSEESRFNVLLLERGADPGPLTEVPILWASNLKSDIDYQYISEPDERLFKGLDGEVSSIPRAKTSGGCSSINVCVYLRGNRRDFDDWAKSGCTGWDYESVMKYFLKAEDYQGHHFDPCYHQKGGPLTVSSFEAPDPAIEVFSQGYRQMGLQEVDDLNGPSMLGFSSVDSTTKNGRRMSSFKAYIPMAANRPNFFFARNVLVRRVIFDKWKTATGVEITAPNEKICVIQAEREVILSLGAIGTPQVLMLSGIGRKERLKKVGIKQLVESAVGDNYQDHLCFIGTVMSDRKSRSQDEVVADSEKLIRDTYQLVKDGISTMGLTELVAFIDTTDSSQYPDIELMPVRISHRTMTKAPNGKHKLYNMFGLSPETADLYTQLNNITDTIFVIVILLTYKSTGYIELNSDNPAEYPKIQPLFLRHPEDTDTMLRAIKFLHRLTETDAFKNYGLELEPLKYKGCSHTEPFSDDYWLCALDQIATGFYHPGSSAKMGGSNDNLAVLTPRLFVKGVRGLRVCDASAMPWMVSANPNATVIMMAEKLADMIKEDHQKSLFNLFRCLLMTVVQQNVNAFGGLNRCKLW